MKTLLHNSIVVLKALSMGMTVQLQSFPCCVVGDVIAGDPLCLGVRVTGAITEQHSITVIPTDMTVDAFMAICNEMTEEEIVGLEMDIALNESKIGKAREIGGI